ncbi:Aminoacyl-tRNA synthetase, class II [Cynara cardunculus var. scolymus]|uniref:phenylalanine--tRNA ligase n=1 Tax=Cynara cardunculus var. scolymus TaxID=59895 RepID=A0A118K547_CYNCS|nr:Aminoacyl-tRNA synthetase, class II [Cynara cardunculus var. scolymus]
MAEEAVLGFLEKNELITDSGEFAVEQGISHDEIVNVIKSLNGFRFVDAQDIKKERWQLTAEGKTYAANGSPEFQLFMAIPQEGISRVELQKKLGDSVFKIGCQQAIKNKWVEMGKSQVSRKVAHVDDNVKAMLVRINDGEAVSQEEIDALKRRKLISPQIWKGYSVRKGPNYAPKRRKPATDLTRENLQRGDWKDLQFKEYNFSAKGLPAEGGTATNADDFPSDGIRGDAHKQLCGKQNLLPQRCFRKIMLRGYQYDWKRDEANKNLLRTHTTAVSSRMLYALAQKPFEAKKYYSVDRVFRNEAVDRTHLAEFHQIEGLICDRGLNLGDLQGVLYDFFSRLGMSKLRFKPAYNPYTEPSMEIFGYHEGFKKWVEVGNSGMFRPEMLLPMGLPEDVRVIAWGLSLERPTMILYGIDNIRDLFGHKVDLSLIKSNPICRIGLQ